MNDEPDMKEVLECTKELMRSLRDLTVRGPEGRMRRYSDAYDKCARALGWTPVTVLEREVS